jgi:hypothetical protein
VAKEIKGGGMHSIKTIVHVSGGNNVGYLIIHSLTSKGGGELHGKKVII